ncbi:family 3 glycoside hydrolase [Cryphonectria parasitica EP155]|uniref:xylan 1,4-beta-xylosidase n=1 Tax=Cryphonectria parasitica (strain ATCC 38755 / EP155) TaxID=660469 RepID=A0A9P4Y0C0_CRYP1|nr:family 3 glycoside hydrolase [Cryphonectria parasitica EP155]KAF3764221.1 family 3 glycoside hydrolase [Cryphonectria parasitica EP155]
MARSSTLLLLASLALLSRHAALANFSFPDCISGPLANNSVCNASLDTDPTTRAKALVSVLTTAEKINATISTSPGVPRLGLSAYEWWNEGLHGIADSPGVTFNSDNASEFGSATSFPQPITMGAAFDDDLIYAVATVVSTEARAFSNNGRAGLDYWTPNINPFRDPRWGRGQETPGEDPFHLSSYVKSLIAGLQGTDDAEGSVNGTYKKVVSTCKHFAGYDVESWDGNYRYQFDASISTQDMVEYYLPSFQACARDAKVGAFMCSYNAVNGVPTCADDWLLNDVLRDHWNWSATTEGWVTSDCDAVQNVFLPHRWADSRAAAAAASLKAGTDLNCGTYYSHHLGEAYDQGLVNDTDLDTALTRLYSSLVRLGFFDSADDQPYRSLGWEDVNTPEAQTLAYLASVEGTVLLKNTNNTLPLTTDQLQGKTVAVLGDWAAATTQMQGSYYGVAPYLNSPLYAVQQLLGSDNVLYSAGPSYGDPTTNSWDTIWEAADAADVLLYFGGIDDSVESEGNDRVSIAWTGAQLDVIGELALSGKPLVVVQMGGGQVDSSPLLANPGVGALLWGGYPGQDGGPAIVDVITGQQAPAGRLPLTQYPAGYIANVSMTDMSLRPDEASGFPGRTYRWYDGEAVFPFGYGLHYTTFTAEMSLSSSTKSFDIASLTSNCTGVEYLDLCPFASVPVTVHNTGNTLSDYVALLFLKGEFGPTPYPLKTLVAYQRAHNISAGSAGTATLNLTLGSLSRVDEDGNRVLYPGSYSLELDIEPGLAVVNFTLTGQETVLDQWPTAPTGRKGSGTTEVGEGYFVGGYGTMNDASGQSYLSS